MGIGAIIDRTAASSRSDEKALELIRKARIAIGGETAIANVQSMVISGRTVKTIKIDGVDRDETGETEIAMQLPNRLSKVVKLGTPTAGNERRMITNRTVDVITTGDAKIANGEPADAAKVKVFVRDSDGNVREMSGSEATTWVAQGTSEPNSGEQRIFISKADGNSDPTSQTVTVTGTRGGTFTTEDGKTFQFNGNMASGHGRTVAGHAGADTNEMLRLTMSLLLTPPQGIDAAFTDGGQASLNGQNCNVVIVSVAGRDMRLFLDSSTNLPVGVNYRGRPTPQIIKLDKSESNVEVEAVRVMGSATMVADLADITVTFSDHRSVGGLQLPHTWTQTIGGNVVDKFEVTGFDINPTNIAERFKSQNVVVRAVKPDTN